jgi:hypothetical protein
MPDAGTGLGGNDFRKKALGNFISMKYAVLASFLVIQNHL